MWQAQGVCAVHLRTLDGVDQVVLPSRSCVLLAAQARMGSSSILCAAYKSTMDTSDSDTGTEALPQRQVYDSASCGRNREYGHNNMFQYGVLWALDL